MTDNPPDSDTASRSNRGYLIGIPLVLLIVYFAVPVPMIALMGIVVESVSGGSVPPSVEAIMNDWVSPLRWLDANVSAYSQWIHWQAELLGVD